MQTRPAIRVYVVAAFAAAALLAAAPARAQFKPKPLNDPATGETYKIEASAGYWFPTTTGTISSESLGIIGSTINIVSDLGLTDTHFPDLKFQVRPAKKHKFRFEYLPISYTQSTTFSRDIVFNGQTYHIGLPVNSTLDWQMFRFGYEYDFLYHNKWFAGFIMEAKYTNVDATLTSPITQLTEFAKAQAPIPAIGGVFRYYVVPNIAITGELTGVFVPKIQDQYEAHFADVDIYGTVNFTNNFGAQVGWRSMNVFYLFKHDTGTLNFGGMYFSVVARY
jgi:hypothetical protein